MYPSTLLETATVFGSMPLVPESGRASITALLTGLPWAAGTTDAGVEMMTAEETGTVGVGDFTDIAGVDDGKELFEVIFALLVRATQGSQVRQGHRPDCLGLDL